MVAPVVAFEFTHGTSMDDGVCVPVAPIAPSDGALALTLAEGTVIPLVRRLFSEQRLRGPMIEQSIGGTDCEGFGYVIRARLRGDGGMAASVWRSDEVLLSEFTVMPPYAEAESGSPYEPPYCFVRLADGVLVAKDARTWLTLLEQTVARLYLVDCQARA